MSGRTCLGLVTVVVLGFVALVGWELYEPRIMDDVAAEAERVDALHAALEKARQELFRIEADGSTIPRLREGQVEDAGGATPGAPALDPKPLHTPEEWSAEFLERARFDDPSLPPGETPEPWLFLSDPSGLPSSLRVSAPGGPFRKGEDDERSFWTGWHLRESLTRRYAIVYGARGQPTGNQSSLPVALIDLQAGAVRDAVILVASEGEVLSEYTTRRLLELRWGASLDDGDTDPQLLERNRRRARLEGPTWVVFMLLLFGAPLGLISWSNGTVLSAVSRYGERFGLEVGAERIMLMKQYPWAEGQVEGRRVRYRTSLRRHTHVGILEVEAKVPLQLRGVVRRRATPLTPTEVAELVGPGDVEFARAFALEGDAAAIMGLLDARARETLAEHLIGALELREDALVFDRGGAFLGSQVELERFEALTQLLLRLAASIEGSLE